MRPDIAPGGTFPDYELTDHAKTRRRGRRPLEVLADEDLDPSLRGGGRTTLMTATNPRRTR